MFVFRTALLIALAASLASVQAGELRFVRGGLLWTDASAERAEPATVERARAAVAEGSEIPFGPRRTFKPIAWQPGEEASVQIAGRTLTARAPQRPAPVAVARVPLEDVSQAAAAMIAPDACVRFSPDSRRLAVGTYGGWLRVLDALSGEVLHQQRIPEGMAKRLAWSPDGKRLYVGEQSPDANLFALEADSWRPLWSVRLADALETSRPAADDSYGRYSLPAVYDLHVIEDGRLFVAGVHSWRVGDGKGTRTRNRSQILSLDPDGKILWRFPAQPAPATIVSLGIDRAGRQAATFVHQTQPREAGQTLDPGTLYLLDAQSGAQRAAERIAPDPHFERAESWDSTAMSPAGDRVAVGLQDGRAMLFRIEAERLVLETQFDLGRPVLVGKIPIAAAASYARIFGDRLYLQTQNTHIPLASAQAALAPPSIHRGANMLTVADLAGRKEWIYRGPFSLTGSWTDRTRPGGRWLLTTCRELPGSPEPGQYGALLFDLARESASGRERLVYYYATEGPVFAQADLSPDGRLFAVVEIPALRPNGRDLFGTHQLHVVH